MSILSALFGGGSNDDGDVVTTRLAMNADTGEIVFNDGSVCAKVHGGRACRSHEDLMRSHPAYRAGHR